MGLGRIHNSQTATNNFSLNQDQWFIGKSQTVYAGKQLHVTTHILGAQLQSFTQKSQTKIGESQHYLCAFVGVEN